MNRRARRTTRNAVAILAVLAVATLPVLAQRPGPRGGGPFGPGGPVPGPGAEFGRVVMHALDLSDAQRDAIRGILRDARASVDEDTREANRAVRHEMAILMWSPDATEADVQAQAGRIAELDRVRAEHRFRTARAILAELTPEQVAELQELVANPPEMPPRRRPGGGFGRRGGTGS